MIEEKTRPRRRMWRAAVVLGTGALLVAVVTRTTRPGGLVDCGGAALTYEQVAARRGVPADVAPLLENQGMTASALCTVNDDILRRAIRKATTPKPDSPGEYLRWRLLSLRDENGVVDGQGLQKAKAHVDLMRGSARGVAPVAGINRGTWSPIGPGNIGGRIRSLLIHPTTPAIIWAGSVGGGVWKTTNSGTTWVPLDDFMASIAVSTLVMAPGNPNVIYAGTGEGYYNGDGLRGAGVFRTMDGGTTWTPLASTSTAPGPGMSAADFYYVNRLAISPNGATLLAATRSGIFRSTNGGTSFTRATMAGGGAIAAGNGVTDIDFHPANSNLAVAGTYSGTALYSIDGGATWAVSSGLPAVGFFDRVETAFAPSDGSIVYASADFFGDGITSLARIYKSTDAGQTFVQVHQSANVLRTQGWYDNALWVNPVDPNEIVWGGVDLFRSTDGALTFAQISDWSSWSATGPTSAHADQHVIVSHPNFDNGANRRVYFGNDGGVYTAADIAAIPACAPFTNTCKTGWTELNNGLAITQFYGGAGHPASGRITGGTQDNGTLLYNPAVANAAENWTWPFGGDGGFSAYDSADVNYFYGEYTYAQIHRNTTGGAAPSAYIWNGIGDAGTSNAEFVAALRLDPNDNNRMLVAGVRLWRSSNVKAATPAWEVIKNPAAPFDHISAIGIGPVNSNVVYAGHNSGGLYKTIVGTDPAAAVLASWAAIDDNGARNPLPNRRITRITIDPTDVDVVYVTFGGFSGDNVYKSVNGGTSWADITGPAGGTSALPDVPVRALVVNPAHPNWIYAGTEVGIFASTDGGATWSLPHDGPSNVSVDELFLLGNSRMVAVTHGRGMFSTSLGAAPAVSAISNQATRTGVPVSATFTVTDPDTPLDSLALSGSSSNTTLLPNSGIAFSGAGVSRTVTLTPAAGLVGTANVTVTISDGGDSASTTFTLTVTAPPVISAIANQTTSMGLPISVNFTVADADTPLDSLALSGASSNTTLLPNSAIAFSGSGANRAVTLTPAAGRSGTSMVTLTIADGAGGVSASFTLTVMAPPTVSGIANQTIGMGLPVSASFSVADADTALDSLTIGGSSSNTTLLPNSGIAFSGSGASRAITLSPAAGRIGTSAVTVSVSDGFGSASTTFTLTVIAPPSLAPIASQSALAGVPLTIPLTVGDPDTPLDTLVLSGTSSNSAVLTNAAISFGGSGASRTVTVTASGSGTAAVTIVVSDGIAIAVRTFSLTVTSGPSNLTAVVRGNQVIFAWSPSSMAGMTGYVMEAGSSPGATSVTLPLGNVTAYQVAAPSGVYFVRVRALAGSVPGPVSNEVRVAVGDAALPGAPTDLLANVNGSTLSLAWRNPDVGGTRSGLILQAALPASPDVAFAQLPLPAGAESFTAAAPAGSYSLRIVATGPGGNSAPTNAVIITVPGTCAVPATPRNLAATAVGASVTVSWDAGPVGTAAPTQFIVEAGFSPGAANAAVLSVPGRTLAASAPPGTYYLRVRAVSACGASANTPDVVLTVR